MSRIYQSVLPIIAVALTVGVMLPSPAQTAQKGASTERVVDPRLQIDHIAYRPAVWETAALQEVEQDTPNRGGLIYVYITNPGDEPRSLAYYQLNDKDESHWLLGRFLAWHRYYDRTLAPGQTSVLEINAVSPDFAPGAPLSVTLIDRSWSPAVHAETTLVSDPARIASISMPDNLGEMIFHVRYTGAKAVRFTSATVLNGLGGDVTWYGQGGPGPTHAIGRLRLPAPMSPSQLFILRVGVEEDGVERFIYAHRRAHRNEFPIGAWSGNKDTYAFQRSLHLDTLVQGGRSDSEFYSTLAGKYGLKTMVHASGIAGAVDTLRDLGNHEAVSCWMLYDEPDWSILPSDMLMKEESTKAVNRTVPTMITLCRNVKFFEYATIADIPCMDHYAVTAPTSSVWPHPYGTRLEETGYYTRDLKEASEPKPIWVWSQAIADWDQRPKRPVPTPDEIEAQLIYNLGRGAKGILWFNFSMPLAEQFPDAIEAMRGWGRVMYCVRDDLLDADPIQLESNGPELLDIATLATPDKLFVMLNNKDYDIHPEAYPFRHQKDVEVTVSLPDWITPARAIAIAPEGISEVAMAPAEGGGITLRPGDISVSRVIVLLNHADDAAPLEATYAEAVANESRTY